MIEPANPNTFANSPLDRAGHRRREAAWLEEACARADARVALFHKLNPFVFDEDGVRTPGWLGGHARVLCGPGASVLFLGVDQSGAPHFAAEVPDGADMDEFPLAAMGAFEDMRAAAMLLPAPDAAILGCAKAILDWHRRHAFCAQCGAPSQRVEGGWKRLCASCGAEHFPRVDPVVIMLATFGDKCLLGRQARFPRGMYSALAGFVEPGESIEEAVARETLEEAGLTVRAVRYHSTQPWPFPSSLMIGCLAEVAGDRETIDHEELESARWFTREEARLLVAGKHCEAFAPPPFAIAHQLLKTWASAG